MLNKKLVILLFSILTLVMVSCKQSNAQDESHDSTPLLEQAVNQTNLTSIIFPNHEFGKTNDNAEIYDIMPFIVNLQLPTEWSVKYPEKEEEAASGISAVQIYSNDKYVGNISYNIFEINLDTTEENFYRSVYSELMLGGMVTWDNNYQELKHTDSSAVATCDVLVNSPNGQLTFPGILSYNKDISAYIMISFENSEIDLLDEDILSLAESIEIVTAQ